MSETYSVRDLRDLYWELRQGGSLPAQGFWDEQLQHLPGDEETVSSDQIANALKTWLVQLLEQHPQRPGDDHNWRGRSPVADRTSEGESGSALSPSTWLAVCEPDEPPEVMRFRERLLHRLGDAGPEMMFVRLYRAVRDALEDEASGSVPGSSRRVRDAALRAGVERLGGVVSRQVRMAFRELEKRHGLQAARRAPQFR